MAEQISIAPSNLLIDSRNPRLRQPNSAQREALRLLAKDQGRKLLVLARDVCEHGLDPSNLPIVMRLKGDDAQYVVLEGNRRLTALRALENPELV